MSTIIVRRIGELCTCDPARGDAPGVIRDAALVARDGVIDFVGPDAELRAGDAAGPVEELDAGGRAVLPGLIDSHTHLVWLGDRGAEYAARARGATYEEVAAAGGGIRATLRATAAGSLEELVAAARPRAAAALRQGTTTMEVKSGYGLAQPAEMRQLDAAAALGMEPALPEVVTTYLPLHALPESHREDLVRDVCADGVREAASRARFADAFCEQGAYSVDECERFFRAATAAGLRPKVHAEQLTRSGGAQLAARCGAVSADHLEHASDGDLRALAQAGVVGVLLPGASLVLGGPPPPGARLLEAGATIAIATDCNPGTCYSESLPLMLSLAVATAGITPAQAVVAATRGGAAALALRDRGMLRHGMRCDLAILRTEHWIDVAYHLGGDVVAEVVIGGRRVTSIAAA